MGPHLLTDPFFLAAALFAVTMLGLAKGGFAGLGALATPVLALTVPPVEAAAIVLPIMIVQDVVSVWAFRKSWSGWIIAWMLPGALAGIGIGFLFAALLREAAVMAMLGAITLTFGLYRLWIERGGRIVAPSQSPGWVGSLFGVAVGFTSQIAHAGGPPFQIWVAPQRLPHQTYVGTNAILFATINWAKVPAYLALGAFGRETLTLSAALLPVGIAATLASVWLIRRMDAARFYGVVYVLMVVLGVSLLWEALA